MFHFRAVCSNTNTHNKYSYKHFTNIHCTCIFQELKSSKNPFTTLEPGMCTFYADVVETELVNALPFGVSASHKWGS